MARKSKDKKDKENDEKDEKPKLHPYTKKSILVVVFVGAAILFILAGFGEAGPLGEKFYVALSNLFGWGYYLLPIVSFILAFAFVAAEEVRLIGITLVGGLLFLLSGAGVIDI